MKGDRNHNWKGGRSLYSDGYVRMWTPADRREKLEHVVIMEKYLGRKMRKGEVIHHLNMDKADNRLENLFVCTGKGHNAIHLAYQRLFVQKASRAELKRICEEIKYAPVACRATNF